jgi:hypothetical protein
MKTGSTISLSFLLALGMLFVPQFAAARNVDTTQSAQSSSSLKQAKQEAAEMVPAAANLKKGIDARKLHAGDPIEAILQQTVHLKNGPELKKGTILFGKVTTDQMQQGHARLALSFTRAQTKGGQAVPIKATVLQIAPPDYTDGGTGGISVANETGLWQGNTLQVDQIGALRGIDMHSKIASANSVVFVSSKKDDVKLKPGSQFLLAIAKRS